MAEVGTTAGGTRRTGPEHRVRDWTVPLRDGADPVVIGGTLDWVPPPDAYTWWTVTIVGLLAVGALGLVAAAAPAGARALSAVGALLVVGGALTVVYPVGRELDAGAQGVGGVLVGLLSGQIWSLLTGLGAVAAGWYALARRPAADFAVALAGACLALFGGAANAAVFARSIAPVPLVARGRPRHGGGGADHRCRRDSRRSPPPARRLPGRHRSTPGRRRRTRSYGRGVKP